jgi:hypothetical protein
VVRNGFEIKLIVKKILILTGDVAREAAKRYIDAAPDGFAVTIGEKTRSLEQNALLHALLQDIADKHQYANKKRSPEFWKGLFVSGWMIATGQKPEIIPGLEGEFINIRESTTTLTPKRISDLIEYIHAWQATQA